MYSIRQFKPVLYALLLLGMTGYALASQSPAVWVLGCGGVILNGWLVFTGRFKPLPRVAANIITLGAMLFVARELFGAGQTAVLVIGQFLVVLQLIKLWEQRANRDYGQLLVLSLLLMVAAVINTASLMFAVLLIAYLFLSLYCCLLFHLKVETDIAKSALAQPEEKVSPQRLRQDQRFLTRSMRRLTGIVSTAAIGMAVFVFLFFPRGAGQNILTPMQFRASQSLTGFSDQMNLDQVASITKNDAVVAYLELFKDRRKVEGPQMLYLRGVTLDTYRPEIGKGKWERTSDDPQQKSLMRELAVRFNEPPQPEDGKPAVEWRQKIQLEPTGTRVIFALAGAYEITANRELQVKRGRDGAMQSADLLVQQLDYEVVSSGVLEGGPSRTVFTRTFDPTIEAYARRADVSGSDANGTFVDRRLAQQRERAARLQRIAADPLSALNYAERRPRNLPADSPTGPLPIDAEIADSIERHFKGPEYHYTLDITDAENRKGRDPIAWFLSDDGKRGHCEYYAGAMALLCQSLGLDARVVVGFKTDDYNPYSGRFLVRQSHAHAWVEVLTADGWRRYDPTSGREGQAAARNGGFWQKVKHFFNFLEFTYANNVIAYDNDNRENLIQSVENRMSAPIYAAVNRGSWSRRLFDSDRVQSVTNSALGVGAVVVALVIAGIFAWWVWRQVKLRRRASRIGIRSLPPEEQLRLARQLGFYDDLVRLLARHQIARPAYQTPLEFSRSLMYLPSDVYETIRRLTSIFYRVRFGQTVIGPSQLRRLARVIGRVEGALSAAFPVSK